MGGNSGKTKWVVAGLVLLAVGAMTYALRLGGERSALRSYYQNMVDEVRLSSQMLDALQASVEAEKSAVLADTDADSLSYAGKSANATDKVLALRGQLAKLVERGGDAKAEGLLHNFDMAFSRFRKVDKELLDLAVQNTNLKAMRLCFGPAWQARERFTAALDAAVSVVPAESRSRAAETALRASLALAEAHFIENPHIAENFEGRMGELEKRQAGRLREVRDGLTALRAVVPAAGRSHLDAAGTALEDFARTNAEILRLSRLNTNNRSFVVSLNQKRLATAECVELLEALRNQASSRDSLATR